MSTATPSVNKSNEYISPKSYTDNCNYSLDYLKSWCTDQNGDVPWLTLSTVVPKEMMLCNHKLRTSILALKVTRNKMQENHFPISCSYMKIGSKIYAYQIIQLIWLFLVDTQLADKYVMQWSFQSLQSVDFRIRYEERKTPSFFSRLVFHHFQKPTRGQVAGHKFFQGDFPWNLS